jgi:phosphoserine phosphatase
MEAAWHSYDIDNRTFATRDAVNYRGVAVAEVEARLADLPLITGLDQVCQRLIAAGILVKLASCGWSFAGRYLQRRFELHDHSGTQMAEADGILLGRVARFCDEADKAAQTPEPPRTNIWIPATCGTCCHSWGYRLADLPHPRPGRTAIGKAPPADRRG